MANDHIHTSLSRSYLFAFLGMIMLALTVFVIWDDEYGLRPWKRYQSDYKKLKRAQLEKEYQHALVEFDSAGGNRKLAELELKLKKAEEIFRSPENQNKYNALKSRLEDIQEALSKNQKQLQRFRGEFLETEYYYIKNQNSEDRAKMQALQSNIDNLDERRKRLLEQEETLKESIMTFTAETEALRAEIQNLKSPLEEMKERLAKLDDVPIEIKQIHINDVGKADRCQSCHIGINDIEQVSDELPFTKHPASFIYLKHHQSGEYGCTFCHRGQGRATTSIEKAHGNVKHWDEPMYEGDMTQTSCLTCHSDVKGLRGAEYINNSTELFKKYGCYGCHKISGYEGLREIGPVLTEVGTKTNYSWMVEWLLDPKSYFKTARMPKFFLGRVEAEAIADYLFSMTRTARHDEDYEAYEIDWDLADKGKNIWSQSRCNLCHVTGGRGGNHVKMYAPDLSKVGTKVNKQWLFNWIKDPKKYFPETKMPRFRFSDDEIHALVEFIMSEYIDDDYEPGYTEPEPLASESIEKGKRLIQKYGCFGCHELQGMEEMAQVAPLLRQQGISFLRKDEMGEKIGTELSSIGSKPVDLLDFGKLKKLIPHDRLSYLKQKLRAPRSFRDNLVMPDFQLTEDEVNQLSAILYGFTDANVPARYIVPSQRELHQLAGVDEFKFSGDFEKLVEDVKCTNCHAIKGIGEDYAPDLSMAGSKLQESWIKRFLGSPDVIRPLIQQMPNLGLAQGSITMPRFNLDKEEVLSDTEKSDIDIVLNYFKQELVSKDIPKKMPELEDVSIDEQIVLGKKLYDEKGCMACHQIGMDGGAVGPNLSDIGNRLNEGFVFVYLQNPQRFKPDVVEPNYNLSERERIYLTNYLMTLKLDSN